MNTGINTMSLHVKKRDGSLQLFDLDKVQEKIGNWIQFKFTTKQKVIENKKKRIDKYISRGLYISIDLISHLVVRFA